MHSRRQAPKDLMHADREPFPTGNGERDGCQTLSMLHKQLGNAALQSILRDQEPDASAVFTAGAHGPGRSVASPLPGQEPLTVHQGPQAQAALDALNAEGATLGEEILLGFGAGPEVLSHEAVHVAQNRGGSTPQTGLDGGASGGAEREADAPNLSPEGGAQFQPEEAPGAEVQRSPLGDAWESVWNAVGSSLDSQTTGDATQVDPSKSESVAKLADGLHFFPGPKILIYAKAGKIVGQFKAVGGPEKEQPKTGAEMPAGPTNAGHYLIEKMEAYHTPSWGRSNIAWGTPLQDKGNDVWYQLKNGIYASVQRDFKISRKDIMEWHLELYKQEIVPNTWVFNDFGPLAVRYYKDLNKNGKQDTNEPLEGEMIHTTPENEAQTENGESVELGESHGCIHVRPVDRDTLKKLGAFKSGVPFTVHPYNELSPAP